MYPNHHIQEKGYSKLEIKKKKLPYVSVRGKRNKIFIFYIMRFVRAQLCASNIGNDEWLYKIQFPTILRLIHNIYHWTKIEESIHTFVPLVNHRKSVFFWESRIFFILGACGCARAFVPILKMNLSIVVE